MNRRKTYHLDDGKQKSSGFFVCLIFFLCGVFVGIFSARALDASGAFALRENTLSLIESISEGTHVSPSFFSTFWLTGRYHLLASFLGFSILGMFFLPVLAGVRGFYLSFSVAALIRAFGPPALPLALSLFGVWAMVSVPTFFFLANQSFDTAVQLGKSLFGGPKLLFSTLYGRKFLQVTVLSFLAVILLVLLELYFTPILVLWTSSFL